MRPAALYYRFHTGSHRALDLRVAVVSVPGRDVVSRWTERDVAPGERSVASWSGYEDGGAAAADGRYAFRIGPRGGVERPGGRFQLHGHAFPVDGAHGTRGEIGEFGADRVGGRRHEGFDVTAPCGTPLRAARGGRVERRGYDPELYGNFLQIDARRSRFDLFYAHLREPAAPGLGEKVKTAARVGEIGITGNAYATPCHLHFEMRIDGRPIDPKPHLRHWDSYS